MNNPSFETRSATQDESLQAEACIVAAFITDPMARFAWPTAHDYLQAMPVCAREMAAGCFKHESAVVAGGFGGAALWLPPGVHPNVEAIEELFRDTSKPEHVDDVLATFEKMGEWHPEEPHWYLPLIGVEPNAQCRGIGGELMAYSVSRCDDEGKLAYLESSNPRNISLYKRHGFEVMGEIQVGAAPVITPMVRQPR